MHVHYPHGSWKQKPSIAAIRRRTDVVDEETVFAFLKKQKKDVLLDHLETAFEIMDAKQRRAVFGDIARPSPKNVDGDELLEEITQFRNNSLARKYYAPFNVNSKNYMNIPEETDDWCDQFARFVAKASKLTVAGNHEQAVRCFDLLYELIEAVDWGKEIIFAEEAGSWMIPTDEKVWLTSYLTSLAATATPEQFATAATPMIDRDSGHSFAGKVYASAMKLANAEQKALLRAELQRRKIRVP